MSLKKRREGHASMGDFDINVLGNAISSEGQLEVNACYLSVNGFSTKVLIGTLFLPLLLETEAPFLHGHLSHAKVQLFAAQRQYLHFSVILRP